MNGTFAILAEATGNAYLVDLFQRLMGDMGRIRVLLLSDPVPITRAPPEHWVRRILAERDPDKAAGHAKRYIEDVHRQVLAAVARWPSVMSSEVVVPVGT